MSIELLENPVLDDFDLEQDISCDFLCKDMTPCPEPGIVRVRLWCQAPCYSEALLWACETHLDILKDGEVGCVSCGRGNVQWKVVS